MKLVPTDLSCLEYGGEFYEVAEVEGQDEVYYFVPHEEYQFLFEAAENIDLLPALDCRPGTPDDKRFINMDSDMQAAVAEWAQDPR